MKLAALFCFLSFSVYPQMPDRVWVGSGHTAAVFAVAVSPDRTTGASGSDDGTVRTWRMTDGVCTCEMHAHTMAVRSVDFSPLGNLLASSSEDMTVRLWDTSCNLTSMVLRGHTSNVRCSKFSPDGIRIASCSHDGTVRLWDMAGNSSVLYSNAPFLVTLSWSPDGKYLAVAGFENSAHIIRVTDGAIFGVISHPTYILSCAYSRDGTMIATASIDLTARISSSATLSPLRSFSLPDWGWCAQFNDTGGLYTTDNDHYLRLWDIASGTQLAISKESSLVTSLVPLPDNQIFYSRADGTVVLANLPAKNVVAPVPPSPPDIGTIIKKRGKK